MIKCDNIPTGCCCYSRNGGKRDVEKIPSESYVTSAMYIRLLHMVYIKAPTCVSKQTQWWSFPRPQQDRHMWCMLIPPQAGLSKVKADSVMEFATVSLQTQTRHRSQQTSHPPPPNKKLYSGYWYVSFVKNQQPMPPNYYTVAFREWFKSAVMAITDASPSIIFPNFSTQPPPPPLVCKNLFGVAK